MVLLMNVSAPTDSVKLTQPSVQVYIGEEGLGNGTLYVSESSLTWISSNSGGKGFSLSYPSIVLHAISTDLTSFAQEHIYVLVDGNKTEKRRKRVPVLMTQEEAQNQQDLEIQNQELNGGEEDGDDDDSEAGKSMEIRLVPDDKDTLSQIYHEIVVCQELNPDEEDNFSEDDNMDYEGGGDEMGEGDARWFTAENMNDVELSEEGLENLNRMLNGGHQNGHDNGDDEDNMQ